MFLVKVVLTNAVSRCCRLAALPSILKRTMLKKLHCIARHIYNKNNATKMPSILKRKEHCSKHLNAIHNARSCTVQHINSTLQWNASKSLTSLKVRTFWKYTDISIKPTNSQGYLVVPGVGARDATASETRLCTECKHLQKFHINFFSTAFYSTNNDALNLFTVHFCSRSQICSRVLNGFPDW